MTLPFVPTQQFKLHRFCFFGQGRRLWESKLGVTLQVRPVWDASGDPVIQGAAVLWDLCGSHFKRREERSLVSGILFPRQWAAFLTPAELVKHHGRFPLLSPENQDRNLMLPPLNLWQGSRGSKLITTQTLSHPPVSDLRGAAQKVLIKTSSQSLTNMSKKTQSKYWCLVLYKEKMITSNSIKKKKKKKSEPMS